MFAGYEGYIAVAICLFCTWLGYMKGKRSGVENAIEGMVALKLLKILPDGRIIAGSNLELK